MDLPQVGPAMTHCWDSHFQVKVSHQSRSPDPHAESHSVPGTFQGTLEGVQLQFSLLPGFWRGFFAGRVSRAWPHVEQTDKKKRSGLLAIWQRG